MTAGDHRRGWASPLVVLAAGVVMGVFVWKTYFDVVPHLYPLAFQQGQWLVAADEGPQGYFRKELYIPNTVQRAWTLVAATDSFILYVNGRAVDAKAYASLKVSGIYDIGPYLHPGKNVLGVVARRRSYPGPAMAVLEGVYVDRMGHEHAVATDASWKFSATEQRQGAGDILWHSEPFDDIAWILAKTAGHPSPSEVYPLEVHPLAFTMPPQGKWIGYPHAQTSQATFTYALTLFHKADDAWIRIAAAQPYSLVINGVTVTGAESPSDVQELKLVQLAGDPIWKDPGRGSMDLYRIAPLLTTGVNRITITSGPWLSAWPGLFVDGFLISHCEVLTFGSDSRWSETFSARLPDEPGIVRSSTTVLADRDSAGGSFPVKQVMQSVLPLSYIIKQLGRSVWVASLTAGLTFMLWKGTSRLLQVLTEGDPAQSSGMDALAHLAPLLILGSLFLARFDVRFDPALPFQGWAIWLAVATLLVLKAALMLDAWAGKKWPRPALRSWPVSPRPTAQSLSLVVLAGLMIVGAILRLHHLDAQSLYHDEAHMLSFVEGLLNKGYPHKMIGPFEIPLATYELVPYPIALSTTLLGMNDFALRLPAALFGIMTIPLIYAVGRQVFDERVGLLAAALYAFCPQALVWAKYLWHPQQTQFFALLTSYLFYRAISHMPMSPKYLYLTAISFIITYLSWEGAGFLLPALGIGLLVVKGQELSWLRDKHLWIATGMVVTAIALQLIRRILYQVPYLVVGMGLSDVSLPTLFFRDPMYDPTFYVKNFLWLENNAILTVLLIGGLPFLFKHVGLSYYATLLLTVLLMMTNLLPHATIRYVYYLQPFLILSAATVALYLVDSVVNVVWSSRLPVVWLLQRAITLAVVALVILGSSPFMQLYRLNDFSYPTGIHTRADTYYSDYRSTAQYVRSHYQPGDLLVAVMPEVFHHYANLTSDYFVQDYTKRQVLYDPIDESSRYLDKMMGIPVIRSFEELQGVFSKHRRIWIVAVPSSIFGLLSGPEIMGYVSKYGRVVYESYDARIYLLQS
jgi:Dolichyl-phosphate-mannose-protein mannosyltransferase